MTYIQIFADKAELLEPFDDAERGRLLTAMMAYAFSGELVELTGNERYIWPVFKRMLDDSAAALEAKRSGGRSRQASRGQQESAQDQQNPAEPNRNQQKGSTSQQESAGAQQEPAKGHINQESRNKNQETRNKTQEETSSSLTRTREETGDDGDNEGGRRPTNKSQRLHWPSEPPPQCGVPRSGKAPKRSEAIAATAWEAGAGDVEVSRQADGGDAILGLRPEPRDRPLRPGAGDNDLDLLAADMQAVYDKAERAGLPSSALALDKLTALVADYGAAWVSEAIDRAVERGSPNLGYLAGILARYRKQGGPDSAAPDKPRGGVTHGYPDAKNPGDGGVDLSRLRCREGLV